MRHNTVSIMCRYLKRRTQYALVRRAAVLLFTLCMALACVAQQRISGRVITVDSIPVWKAVVKLHPVSDTTVAVSTHTDEDGRFEFLLTGIGEAPPVPHALRLEQNYPNPFSRGTTFHFSVPTAGDVLFAIYDRMGRRVRTLVSESLTSGRYSIGWDGCGEGGSRLAPGPYHALLRTMNGVRTRVALVSSSVSMGNASGLRREAGTAVLSKSPRADYRISVLDTVAALPRFVSTSVPLALGAVDTSLTITVEYGGWEDLEFPTPNAYRLFFDAPYLYVAALKDGVWRRNVRTMTGWEYLGLADSTVEFGVEDLDAFGDR